MAVKEIIEVPDERLRVSFTPIAQTEQVQEIIDDMLDTLYATENGIGLAAPQIGHKVAIVVIDLSEQRDQPLILINPEIVEAEGKVNGDESCLSVPWISAPVERYQRVKVKALDRHGKEIFVVSDEFLAIVMQHEIDHLHGKIFLDHLSPLKYQMAMKKIKKQRKLMA